MLKSNGADLSAVNYDHRTALHIACSEGKADMVKHLLLSGAAVHIRDRNDRTPLMDAISNDHHDIIKLLLKCGSHMTGSARGVGEHLCAAAARGLMKRLDSYRIAGADLSQPDPSGRTALHVACLHGNLEIVEYLLKHSANVDDIDLLGLTPMNYAKAGGHERVIKILPPIENGENK